MDARRMLNFFSMSIVTISLPMSNMNSLLSVEIAPNYHPSQHPSNPSFNGTMDAYFPIRPGGDPTPKKNNEPISDS